jgi:transcriptional regulator with GAF, ATPase, and Fis domain
MLDLVSRVAPVNSTALLLGESGTGKELIADAIHAASPRRDGPLVKVACAALAEGVLEAELFGSEKGAYTGAHEQRMGRFELAHTGTLFLDEVGEIPLQVQVKLLRVLQEGEFERVGGTETIRTDVRVIAATNRNLEEEVAAGRFREDLYWRLNVIAIQVPPLRHRPEDIPLLAWHFLEKTMRTTGRQRRLVLSPEALSLLSSYAWPGNVRELENAVERAVVLARGDVVTPADMPEAVQRSEGDSTLQRRVVIRFEVGQSLETLEREAVQRTLEVVGGNREAAASLLGIGVATLYRRLREMGDESEPGPADDETTDASAESPAEGAATGASPDESADAADNARA